MSEAAKVRLVRCPKCQNLLPELTDYSVYQCGGCGAVLTASKMNGDSDRISERSDEEKVGGVSEKLRNVDVSNTKVMNLSDGSENDVKSNGGSSSIADKGIYREKKSEKRVVEEGIEVDETIDEPSDARLEKEFDDVDPTSVVENESRSLGKLPERRFQERGEIDQGFPRAKYSEEGPSNNGFDKGGYGGDDRAGLLRKLDELTLEITRSREMVENPKGNVPRGPMLGHHDPYGGSEDWFSDSSSGMNRPPPPYMQYPVPDQHMARPSYMNHYPEAPGSYMNVHGMGMGGFYPPPHRRSHFQGVADPVRSQMNRKGPHHGYYSGHYVNNDMDSFERYPQHHLSCTCFYCSKKNQVSYQHENPGSFGPRDYGPRATTMPPVKSHNLHQSLTRWSSDVDSETSSFVPRRPPMVQPSANRLRCRPIAGGAPFVTCYNCFEALQVPKRVSVKDSNHKKLRCGSCSSLIALEVSNTSPFVSVHEPVKDSTPKIHPNRANLTFSSDDYDHSGFFFQAMDRELVSQSIDQPGSAKSTGTKSLRSISSATSEDEPTLENRKNLNRNESPTKGKAPPPMAGSSLQDYFEYSNKYHRGKPVENGNRSKRSDQETLMSKKTTPTHTKNASEATEMEISSNEYSNMGTSLGSGGPSGDRDQLKANKAAASFFAGIKKSFRDSDRSNQKVEQEKANVTVNGHLIPERLLKKAEKLAGPVQPGRYWYDFRAGFWGVMGGPCLGIIPPFIEEFNYPMPENCAGGNTSVFVNGRELHQRDLNLLVSRALPTERNRSYIVEMSGRVLDEETGEELESLGKLAPTVEKAKHGFGMKPPKATA